MKNLIMFFKNAWYFRNELSKHSGREYLDSLSIFKRSLERISDTMKIEHNESFVIHKRLDKINRAIALIDKIQSADYYELSMKQMDMEFKKSPAYSEEIAFSRSTTSFQDMHNALILSIKLEDKDWIKLWTLLKNNNYGLRSWWV